MIELRGFGKILIFYHFSLFSNVRNFAQIDRFFRFLSQIKALFFYFNRFCEIFVVIFKSLPLVNHQWLFFVHFFNVKFP